MTDETIPDDIMQAANEVAERLQTVFWQSPTACIIARALMAERAKCEAAEPWLPPRIQGFSPWVEYKQGDAGPRVGEIVNILYDTHREQKRLVYNEKPAGELPWKAAVAYCVKQSEAELATLCAENERLREALAAIDQYEIFDDASLVNQIFRLKNSARAALKGGE